MACVDTTVLIDLARSPRAPMHRRAVVAVTDRLRAGDFLYVPRPAEAEFRVGQFRSRDTEAEAHRIDAVLQPLPVLELDQAASLQFARSKAHLLALGRPAGDMDVLIAAVAMANGQELITRNPRHFADIPGLVVATY